MIIIMIYPLIFLSLVLPSFQEIVSLKTLVESERTVEKDISERASCEDNHGSCQYWAGIGECENNPNYMHLNCKKSCKTCGNAGKCDPNSNPSLKKDLKSTTLFHGTVHELPNIIRKEDGTTFQRVSYAGRQQRTMWDYRVFNWIQVKAFIFNAFFSDDLKIEIRVNPEFKTKTKAKEQAIKYSEIIGRVPRIFRDRLEILDLNKGTWSDGGRGGGNFGRRSMNLNTGCGEDMIKKETIENFFLHEGGHVSFDYLHQNKPEWICAENDDGGFISSYARDNPEREDIAESVTAWYAITFHPERLSEAKKEEIQNTIPNRLEYFNKHITL